jgi:hypothetical protein
VGRGGEVARGWGVYGEGGSAPPTKRNERKEEKVRPAIEKAKALVERPAALIP